MKKLGIIFILVLSLISCSSNNDKKAKATADYYGKWTLIRMTGMKNTSPANDAPIWQESYVFNTDGTFVKTRTADNTTVTATGKFNVTKNADGPLFEVTFKEKSSIIGTCFGNLTENLRIDENSLLVSSWQACDGPGLYYKKSE